MNRLKTILLTMLLAVAFGAAGQGYVIDSVCQGAERHYRIDGENGYTYEWSLTDPQGTITRLPETADTVTINWNRLAGNYILSVLQTSVYGCDSLELGIIKVFENPEIIAIQTFNATNSLSNGYAVINTGNSASDFEYSLNGINWQTSNIFIKLPPGSFTAFVKNENGCITSKQLTILNSVAGEVKILASNAKNCVSVPFEIPIMAHDFSSISAFTIQLAFDPTLMSFNGITQATQLLNNGVLSASLASPGILEISFESADSLSLSGEQLFDLSFNGLSAGHTELKWNWLNCVIYSASKSEMPAIYTQGEVEITAVPIIFAAGGNGYCEGTPIQLSAGSLTGQTLDYEWTSPDGTTHSGAEWDIGLADISASGEYQVTASDGPSCAATERINVQVYPAPFVKISDYDTLCSEQEVNFNAGLGFASYEWQDGSTEPQMAATYEGLYWVIVTDNNGCQATDSVLLQQCDLLLWMPNAFTPNGDGLNDVFLPNYKNDVEITFQMLIFNKWGEQIFSTNNISKGWDGTYKGVLCTEDLYTWTITFSAPDNYKFLQKSPQSGNVMLLK
ncbi:MAG: gliding motility-associated C-terminal domain-containing protein [Bacteroidales bacterium]|nr:gliding motility-associated C-terminal domain-containing protein [Bacteroidales bacterium]